MDKMYKIVIWGTGKYANMLLDVIDKKKCVIEGVINDGGKSNSTCFEGIKIFEPNCINNLVFDYLFIAIEDYNSIVNQYDKSVIPRDKIIVLNEFQKKIPFIDYYYLSSIFSEEIDKLKSGVSIENIESVNLKDVLENKIELIEKEREFISEQKQRLLIEEQRIQIERKWYEEEKAYFREEQSEFRIVQEKYREDLERISIERNWFADERNRFADERNRFVNQLQIVQEKYREDLERISIERNWFADERNRFINQIQELEKENAEIDNQYKYQIKRENLIVESAPYEYGKNNIVILPADKLLNIIIEEGKSLARFGDGEFELIFGCERPWFQLPNKRLAERLKEVLQSEREDMLIAVADNFGRLDKYTDEAAMGIREYLSNGKREKLIKLLGNDRTYYDAYVSRPYLMYKDKSYASTIFRLYKKLWKDRNVLLVEGKAMKSGAGNDLFDNVRSIRRIICPAQNAFDVYEEICIAIENNYNEGDLILIGLGPTATILAYDICIKGMQAIDLGQLDNEYEWFKRGTLIRCNIEGKGVPELSRSTIIEGIFDKEISEQIICEIK